MELPFQREELNKTTRLQIWNVLNHHIWHNWDWGGLLPSSTVEAIENLLGTLWLHHFHWDLDKFELRQGNSYSETLTLIKRHFIEEMTWWEAYDFLEFFPRKNGPLYFLEILPGFVNHVLAENNADHRFVGNEIAPIIHAEQIDAIERGITTGFPLVSQHLKQALTLFSDHQAPDYRNSIKESISAVECACKVITGDPKATLGEALKKIPHLHTALKEGFLKFYGYTSQDSGIRHALTADSVAVDKDDAQFMLVACSAFTSYLTVKAQKTP